MLFMSAPQLKALGRLTENIDMKSFTVEDSPTRQGIIRVTMWDGNGRHAIVDIEENGIGKKVNSVV